MKSEKDSKDVKDLPLTEIMLEFVRAAILERDPVIPVGVEVDWDGLMDISRSQGLIAWVWDGICRLPMEQQPPRQYRINWGMSAQEIWDRYEQQKRVLGGMVEICNQNNIRLLLMKGLGLSELYPKHQSRPSGDIDIYLFDDYEKGNILFGDGVNYFYHKHASYDYHGVHVENHLTPLDTDTKFERQIGSYLQSDIVNACLTPDGYYTFSPMSNLVYLITHSLHHFNPHHAVPLRNLIDIIIFVRVNKDSLPPRQCYQILSKLRLDKAFELFLTMGEILLNIEMPEYHFGIVKQKHKEDIKDYILTSESRLIVSDKLPKSRQLQLLSQNYRRLKHVYKYLPSKKENILFVTYRHYFAIILKRLIRIPESVPFIQGIRSKFHIHK